eukprot:scaffold222526_cov28-Tisochrysis_lutea.AAC.4
MLPSPLQSPPVLFGLDPTGPPELPTPPMRPARPPEAPNLARIRAAASSFSLACRAMYCASDSPGSGSTPLGSGRAAGDGTTAFLLLGAVSGAGSARGATVGRFCGSFHSLPQLSAHCADSRVTWLGGAAAGGGQEAAGASSHGSKSSSHPSPPMSRVMTVSERE